jgi:hypothetical protein
MTVTEPETAYSLQQGRQAVERRELAAAAGEGRAEHIHQTVPAIGILGMHRCSHPRDGDSGACACTLRAIEIRLPGDV